MLGVPVHLSVGFDDAVNDMGKDDLLILDEADWHLLDKLSDLPKKCYGVLAMTATDVGNLQGNEKKLLDMLKIQTFDSKIKGSFDASKPLVEIDDESFMDMERSHRARLIWCTEEQKEHFKLLCN